jgi:ubiquitin-conjugating enzyme E2 D
LFSDFSKSMAAAGLTRLQEERAVWADGTHEAADWAEAEPKTSPSGGDIMTEWELTLMGPVRHLPPHVVLSSRTPPSSPPRAPRSTLTLLFSAPLTLSSFDQDDTPYAEGVFMVNLKFPMDYPARHPEVKFITRIYHPSVNTDGATCIPEIKEDWSMSMSIVDIANILKELLTNPCADSPVNAEAGAQLAADPDAFNEVAAQWTKDYAQ